MFNAQLLSINYILVCRQRDHVFRPQMYWFGYCIITTFVVATPSRHRDLDIFQIFSCPFGCIKLSRCRCHEAKKTCRVPSSANKKYKHNIIIQVTIVRAVQATMSIDYTVANKERGNK